MSSGGATALECGDDGLPDVLVGHAMLARQDHASRTSTSWQQQQPPPLSPQQQQSQHHSQHTAAAAAAVAHQHHHHHHSHQIPQATQSLHQQPQLSHHHHQQSQQYHASPHHQQQQAQASFTPLGLGAHIVDWRNEGGASTSSASGGAFGGVPYQDSNRGYLSPHHGSFPEPDAATRYSQNCSGLPDTDATNLRYHHPGQSPMVDSSEAHYGQHHLATGQDPDGRFGANYSNPASTDTDSRYLALSVNDARPAYGQQPFLLPEDDARVPYSGASYQVDNGVTVRYRSMSSEPRSGRKDAENRRIRCSSANRVRQTRSKNIQASTSPSASSPLASPPQATSPPPPSLSVAPPQVTPLPTTSSGSTVPTAQPQLISSSSPMDRQNWDPGPSQAAQQPSASSHDPHAEERNYAMHPPVSSSTGSYGYQVEDLEALLSHSSASQPANLPMVLASPTRLHHMRRTQANSGPSRPFLPLGVIVNAVFKTRDWLYVRTAHGAEGFVPYHVCLPLGILPTKPAQPVSESAAPAAAWEMQETPLPRGRCRERRRQSGATSANQTDLQKLHPMSRTTLTRETLSSQPQPQQPQPQHQPPHQPSGSRN